MISLITYYRKGIETEYERDYDLLVLIDVYRATSSMVVLASKGYTIIRAVESVDEALKARGPNSLICGERNGIAPQGFDHGNSPYELNRIGKNDEGKEIIMTTTNGTKALKAFYNHSENIIAASLINLKSVIDYIIKHSFNKILVLCAGTYERFSIEDYLCASLLVHRVHQKIPVEKTDPIRLALATGERCQTDPAFLEATMRQADHARRLQQIGKGYDIDFILKQKDGFDIVPKPSL